MNRLRAVLARCDRSGSCWTWQGHKNRDGYGRIGVGRTTELVHRFIYTEMVDKITPGMELDHLCRDRACVNPAHLEQVSHAENMRRITRTRITACKRGHEMTPDNTYVWHGQGREERHCRACRKARA